MKLTVRNYHLDGYGHVNNARYLEFLEEARWTFFQEHDLLSELKGIMLVVARVDIRYRRPSLEGDVLTFTGRLKDIRDYCETDAANTYLMFLRFRLMSGALDADEYEVEVKRLKHYLTGQAQDKQHWNEFVAAWR